jgi:hypothetical protein
MKRFENFSTERCGLPQEIKILTEEDGKNSVMLKGMVMNVPMVMKVLKDGSEIEMARTLFQLHLPVPVIYTASVCNKADFFTLMGDNNIDVRYGYFQTIRNSPQQNVHMLFMEECKGTLMTMMREFPEKILNYMYQAICVMQEFYGRGYYHGDLHLKNFLVRVRDDYRIQKNEN